MKFSGVLSKRATGKVKKNKVLTVQPKTGNVPSIMLIDFPGQQYCIVLEAFEPYIIFCVHYYIVYLGLRRELR